METARRPASLRTRTLFLVAVTTLALLVALYVPLRALLLDSFQTLEDEGARRNLARAENAVQAELDQVETTCRDYATWDDTYTFVGGQSPEYPADNLVDDTFEHNRLELVVILGSDGEARFAKFYDLVREAEQPLPDLDDAIARLCPRARCSRRAGLLDTPMGPMMIAVYPVLRSNESGPQRGVLIAGRRLNGPEIDRLARRTNLSLSIARSTPRTPRARTRVLDDAEIAATARLDDVNVAPYLALTAVMPRDVYARGVLGTYVLAAAVAIAGIVFGIVILFLLDRVVLRRVARLSDDVRRVSESADPELRVFVQGDDELAGLAGRINGMLGELANAREVIRSAFGRYVSEDVARAVLSKPELGGELREVTILFSDIRGYSTVSERMAPADVVELLNEYFGAMSSVVEAEGGVVIEFLGDAILAVFGAPGDLPDHAEHAVRAALAIERRGEELNRAWDESGRSKLWRDRGIDALRSRIGLHSGSVVAGNLGSRTRMKYAIIGDTVNTAARVEALNDVVGTHLLLTAEVRSRLGPELAGRTDDRGEHAVKGRERPVHVFTVSSEED